MRKFARLVRLSPRRRQRAALRLAERVFRDERGGEIMEYVLVAGLVVVGAIGSITCVGTKILAKWTSINSSV
jgi:Flp pilus assembly pilin Flp